MKKYGYLYLNAIIISFGGLLSGFDTGVISGALLYINQSFDIDKYITGLIVSSVSLGAVFGALINGILVDRIGRKKVLILTGIIFVLGSILSSFAQNPLNLIISRFLIGVAVGAVSFCAPMYLSETAAKERRGQIVSFYQLFLTFGILLSYIVNYFCAGLRYNWRLMFFFGIIPGVIFLLGLLTRKDTPRFLVLKNKIKEAKCLIEKLNPYINSTKEIEEIKETINCHQKCKIHFEKYFIYPFLIGIGLMFIQVGTGINAIIYYAPVIFKNMGFSSDNNVLLVTIFIGLVNFLMTFPAIKYSDKIGRKPLLYIGLSGMITGLVVLALAFKFDFVILKYCAFLAAMFYIVSFSMSLGPMGLLIISEVFPLKIRGQGMSISIIANFSMNFIVTCFFPVLLNNIGGFYTFSIFVVICLISIIFIHFIVPETKNKSLEEIEKSFKLKLR